MYDYTAGKPVPIPDDIRALLASPIRAPTGAGSDASGPAVADRDLVPLDDDGDLPLAVG